MLTFKIIIWGAFIVIFMSCSSERAPSEHLLRSDSLSIIQTVLEDGSLIREAKRSFGQEPLKLARHRVVQKDYNLRFGGKQVEIVPEETINQQMFSRNSKSLLASIPMLKITSPDTVNLSMVFYAGGATFLYTLIRDDGQWKVIKRQYGKF